MEGHYWHPIAHGNAIEQRYTATKGRAGQKQAVMICDSSHTLSTDKRTLLWYIQPLARKTRCGLLVDRNGGLLIAMAKCYLQGKTALPWITLSVNDPERIEEMIFDLLGDLIIEHDVKITGIYPSASRLPEDRGESPRFCDRDEYFDSELLLLRPGSSLDTHIFDTDVSKRLVNRLNSRLNGALRLFEECRSLCNVIRLSQANDLVDQATTFDIHMRIELLSESISVEAKAHLVSF